MKNKILLSISLSFLWLLCACSDHAPEISGSDHEVADFKKSEFSVSPSEALIELESVVAEIDTKTRPESIPRKIANYYAISNAKLTRAANDDKDNDLFAYVFNFKNYEGFAIVSGDKRTKAPVLVITETGNLDAEKGLDCPGFNFYMSLLESTLKQEIAQYAEENQMLQTSATWSWIETTPWELWFSGGNFIHQKWGQGHPYNMYAPYVNGSRAAAGCTATATALLLAYWKKPDYWRGYTYDWNKMYWHMWSSHRTITPQPRPDTYNMIGRLFQQISLPEFLDMDFGSTSGAWPYHIPEILRSMGFSKTGRDGSYNSNTVYSELRNNRPVVVWGYTASGVGHTWIISARMIRKRTVTTWIDGRPQTPYTEEHYLVGCNMGWSGGSDGYYYSGVFDTATGIMEAWDAGTMTRANYSNGLKMVYDMAW